MFQIYIFICPQIWYGVSRELQNILETTFSSFSRWKLRNHIFRNSQKFTVSLRMENCIKHQILQTRILEICNKYHFIFNPFFLALSFKYWTFGEEKLQIIFFKSFSKFSQWKLPFSARSTFLNELSTDGDENIELN